ncbi:Rieske (2Fe-2S) protein [Streptomyces sp. HU2014]|uniref:Rieske 2Fe-2S domain-containing protein n=1 Tax=Streptomyces sp. HU2014 TaxID=2939414 RepID=UPI00200CAB24|nr:Rieske 2Fe-2S domain-containing protein [Streptomyces sp. HU2014]UQI46045.1 Rieske (2Fe-2S) protein [Streptomyces sp. HU2014]
MRKKPPLRVNRYPDTVLPGDKSGPPALPYPDGWFCAGFSDAWQPGATHTVPYMGEDLVIYRTESGTLRATRPYCPHLGAHLGFDGKVLGEEFQCPLHNLRYATDGTCVHSPYGPAPKLSLPMLPVQERWGIVWVWHHHEGGAPTWDVAAGLTGLDNARDPVYQITDLCGYPQDVSENVVDYPHLTYLHGLINLEVLTPPKYEGPFGWVTMKAGRRIGPAVVESEFINQFPGLAGANINVSMPEFGLYSVNWLLATPTGPGRMRYSLASSLELLDPPHHRGPAYEWLSHKALRALQYAIFWQTKKDAARDLGIFHHKRFATPAKLASGDGPIGAHRKWSRQFYPPADSQAPDAYDAHRKL